MSRDRLIFRLYPNHPITANHFLRLDEWAVRHRFSGFSGGKRNPRAHRDRMQPMAVEKQKSREAGPGVCTFEGPVGPS
jgi:hypothetical protein